VGAEVVDGGVRFRVWAPARREVAVAIDGGGEHPLTREEGGYFSGVVAAAREGTRYRFRLDGGDAFPDPASRFQPEGPHGASQVIDPARFRWSDQAWRGIDLRGRVIYEMHIGTYTPVGTWRAAIAHFGELADLGINVLEVMPVADFPGRFGWGYDGVDLWAPTRLYGEPDDFRRFVDAAHAHGLGVILDVVYNHLGPDGNYLAQYTPDYFTKKNATEWGDAINFAVDGVREFFAENAAYWIDEFHLDGLRLDATQSIHDDESEENIVALVTRRAREAADNRSILITAENEPQEVKLLREYGVDAMWNDDWHHAARVALGGPREAYYTDYAGRPQEFVSMAKHGFLFQGQWYAWQQKRRGTSSVGIAPEHFICYLENHDQVANSARGERLATLAPPGRLRALTALLLLAPQTPLLFQGQEFGSTKPFLYFADHKRELADAVAKGRSEFLTQFPSITMQTARPDDPATFGACVLDHAAKDARVLALYRELIALRRPFERVDGAVLGARCFCLRFFGDEERLLVVNFGNALTLDPVDEPLLGGQWEMLWSSGAPIEERWRIPAESAVLLR
jgi:maltooligosyltrehalose trehalohydrolase